MPAPAPRICRSTSSWCSRSTSQAASIRRKPACNARATSQRCATRGSSTRSGTARSAGSRSPISNGRATTPSATLLDWTLIEDATSAFAFADALAETPLASARWTSLSAAIDYAAPRFDGNGFQGVRRVIDISGDGYNNRGRSVEAARDAAVAAGITINGLPIVNDRPNPWGGLPPKDLDRYFEDRVIGGPGAFIVVARDYTAFASAILSKLLLEIAGERPPPRTIAAAVP